MGPYIGREGSKQILKYVFVPFLALKGPGRAWIGSTYQRDVCAVCAGVPGQEKSYMFQTPYPLM